MNTPFANNTLKTAHIFRNFSWMINVVPDSDRVKSQLCVFPLYTMVVDCRLLHRLIPVGPDRAI